MHQQGEQVGIDDRLDLGARPRSDVGQQPARLLADASLRVHQQRQASGQHPLVEHRLRLLVRPRHQVAQRAQRRGHDGVFGAMDELNEPAHHARLQHRLHPVVAAVADVGQRPARIRQHLHVIHINQCGKRTKRRADVVQRRLGLPAAQVGERPGGVAEQSGAGVRRQLGEQRLHHAGPQQHVASVDGVAGDVAQQPHRLLHDVQVRRAESRDG
mmetsp:Transcript_4067/g.13064  ORF Transcript_4067/g.13064 Transcript_4067/m.13064 type:complete len:214 (-) Transcript_4067:256-897(-)